MFLFLPEAPSSCTMMGFACMCVDTTSLEIQLQLLNLTLQTAPLCTDLRPGVPQEEIHPWEVRPGGGAYTAPALDALVVVVGEVLAVHIYYSH